MEKVQRNSVNKKRNGLQQSKNEKYTGLARALAYLHRGRYMSFQVMWNNFIDNPSSTIYNFDETLHICCGHI